MSSTEKRYFYRGPTFIDPPEYGKLLGEGQGSLPAPARGTCTFTDELSLGMVVIGKAGDQKKTATVMRKEHPM